MPGVAAAEAPDLLIEPGCRDWKKCANDSWRDDQILLGRPLHDWRKTIRGELGLDGDRPLVATGHQTLLWHPGILAKYLATHHVARAHDFASANLVVDQHADEFGSFEIPVRRGDHTLATRTITLTTPRPGVPMSLHEPFTADVDLSHVQAALPSVAEGVNAIVHAVNAHRSAPNAAMQMAQALDDLMQPWVEPMPAVPSTALLNTSLSRSLLQLMADDPQHCANMYNSAVREVAEAGIPTLLVRDDYVELPLWRIRQDGTRMRCYDNDVQRWLEEVANSSSHNNTILLMPRALYQTALLRLGMCDIFVHGVGGAQYDRAMELWIRNWLGVDVAPRAVVSATLRLPLLKNDDRNQADRDTTMSGAATSARVQQAQQRFRHIWHDPPTAAAAGDEQRPSDQKVQLLEWVNHAPPGSKSRRERFLKMHEALQAMRQEYTQEVDQARLAVTTLQRQQASQSIAQRRDWPFPLYPTEMIDALNNAVASNIPG